ncbi:MAG: GGDEF domain-containing protein [archaeon]
MSPERPMNRRLGERRHIVIGDTAVKRAEVDRRRANLPPGSVMALGVAAQHTSNKVLDYILRKTKRLSTPVRAKDSFKSPEAYAEYIKRLRAERETQLRKINERRIAEGKKPKKFKRRKLRAEKDSRTNESDGKFILDTTKKAAERLIGRSIIDVVNAGERDPKTGLLNEGGFKARARMYLTENRNYAFVFIDLNNLKVANDLHGHDAGDRLIKAAADTIVELSNKNHATCGRIGGDEFAILLPLGGTNSAARHGAAVLKQELENRLARKWEQNRAPTDPHTATFSIGFSFKGDYEPSTVTNLYETLMEKADSEMYKDKKAKKAVRE